MSQRRDSPRVALVTGANRGIGFEICRQLAGRKVRVVLSARDERKGQQAVTQLGAHGDVQFHLLDVVDEASIQRISRDIEANWGRLDILVNNAGIYSDEDVAGVRVDLATVRETMEVNTYGPLRLCQVFLPLMMRHHYGRIVNVSSGFGSLSEPGGGTLAYRLSKIGLNAITRILAAEVRGTGVLINAMDPGWVRTEMGGRHAPRSVAHGADTAVYLATLPDSGTTGGFFRDRKPIPW